MTLPTLTRQSIGLALWPDLSRQAASKRLEREQLTEQDRERLLLLLSAKIEEIRNYVEHIKQTTQWEK